MAVHAHRAPVPCRRTALTGVHAPLDVRDAHAAPGRMQGPLPLSLASMTIETLQLAKNNLTVRVHGL